MPELSIIVPVYKVEQYLPKCINSILAQTFSDFELILIDDGSPDRCGEICDEYAEKDERVIVIHQENKGVSAARNAGLDIVRGEYIGFVDSDDWIEPEMYERMMATASNNHADVAICGCKQRTEDGAVICDDLISEGNYDRNQLLIAMYSVPNPLGGVLWNKLFRFEPIKKERFIVHMKNCEDGLFIVDCFSKIQKGIKKGETFYNVRQRNMSASRSQNIEQIFHTVCGFDEIKNRLATFPHEKKLEGLASNMVLDYSVRFSREIIEIHKRTGVPCTKELKGIRRIMLKCILESATKRDLPIRRVHGYLHEMNQIRSN